MEMTSEKWRELVAEQAASGKSALSFCRERGINDNRFFYWRKRLSEPKAGKFVRIGESEPVTIELIGGTKVQCSIGSLKAVLDVLSSR